ncbi:MAG: hypothetical protein M3Q69_00285, partial [Acidobacteriota bacterium]|nr:hypothetical protein [Acidobacteriota bacterium]
MPYKRRITTAERGCLALFFLWLFWLPLPYGSNVPRAFLPLIAVPLFLCAAVAAIRLYAMRERDSLLQPTRPWRIWSCGGALLLLTAILQLIPFNASLLEFLSPDSSVIWRDASRVATLAGVSTANLHPVSVDPRATTFEFFRIAAILASFLLAALLIRTPARRIALASTLCGAALFEALYGLREAALERYEIWGWKNTLILDRVTGTFVNPNHFAHYVAIVLPMSLFLIAVAWRDAGPPDVPLPRRFASLLEHNALQVGFASVAAVACVTSILLAQSRGALLATGAGTMAVAAMLPGRRVGRIAFSAIAGAALLTAFILFLGPQRTVGRFVPNAFERETFVGRRIGIVAAADLWGRFSILGSGLGTFERVVSMEQRQDLEKIYHH